MKPLLIDSPFPGAPGWLNIFPENRSSVVAKKLGSGLTADLATCDGVTLFNGFFGEVRYGCCCPPGEYEVCEVEPPLDCEFVVAGLG